MIKPIVLIFISVPLLVDAASIDMIQDYKCHITFAQSELIAFYRWESSKAQLNMAKLPSKQLTDNLGRKHFIQDVVECVPLGDEFSNEKSQELDKKTPR
ncbi:TapY2 family type IVa secretion system protein [Shewanella sp. JNE10-2]|uniref:TapY2 family type IVa secretion system protein n=1 Tax=unclassified Shewanella TaxID=196818 RepID=UPI002003AD41|nr:MULTISPECIES: TapY2 family type IVa secretion system protein [unclassified Shewanella]MCK7631235.1 TapY2 family type IVa secretion system protein [Shewanella sp. JNE9-1]MCK7635647.1 TapY2 family type IVa secretion system protein [Shewanella sp. JNE17]MCK7646488.1 TapY2 family type IVa secretion system protein [Shewanella sp. JNE3-1]MCK7650873.1 TapY2 family type IVa secretion system protein [Shewanella sp. JNE8]MCK7654443.1 TapY2 family type IVa secretion system protein [Shewanella sp. JNE4